MQAIRAYAGLFLLVCFFIFGYLFDQTGFKTAALVSMSCTLFAIFFTPIKYSISLIIIFIWFQGFLKIVSNYHPVIHVGADLVIIALVFRVLFSRLDHQKNAPPLTWLFAIHFIWITICFFNPYSLGFVPTLAGAKVYITMFLLYFFGYYFVNNINTVKKMFALFVTLSAIQTVFTIYQGIGGSATVLSLHPGYRAQLDLYVGYAFRPFGLTNLAGGPSVYIFLVLPFIAYFIFSSRSVIVKLINATLIPAMALALFYCQVRSAIGKGIIALLLFVIAVSTSQIAVSHLRRLYYLFASALITGASVFSLNYLLSQTKDLSDDQQLALERSLSTFDVQAMSKARKGNLNRFLLYAQEVPFGAGFSRVGASSGAFLEANKADIYFPKNHFFSDNLFINIVIEAGIPGVIIITALILGIIYLGFQLWRREERSELIGPQMAILSSLVAIAIGSYGAEGILYNPESCFFWLFAGVMMAMREPDFETEEKSNDLVFESRPSRYEHGDSQDAQLLS
ncbi:MAG: hypothetical protein K2Q26_05855 [Bdellovibrionales bacterium]|nr:hypothetical protein [Bdellovibrionales bacterium]